MDRKTYLNRYRLYLDRVGLPAVIRRSADEATLRADDLESGAQVAVQVVPAPALGPGEREQLEAEARAAQQIDHINIPRLRDFGFDGDQLVYVTDYLEGITAEDWIKTKGPMPVGAVLRIASQMVSALVAATLHGVIHYAVYPGNILLVAGETSEGEWPLIKVLNFLGVAPSLSHSSGHGHDSLNPADFASPEQLRDGPLTFRSEIYSLGSTLWFLLKGVQLTGGAAALQYAIGLPGPVRELLESMLAENPADRPADPLALQRQIQTCVAQIERQDVESSKWGLPIALAPAPANQSEPVPHRRSPRKSLALAAILVAIAALTAVILAQRTHQPLALAAAPPSFDALTLKPGPEPQSADSAVTEKTNGPATTVSNQGASENKNEEASSVSAALSRADSSIQIASQDIPGPKVDVEPLANVPPKQVSIESPAPVFASSLFSPDRGIPAIDTTLGQAPATTEVPAPAEGPTESEKPITQSAPPSPSPVAEEKEEERKIIPAPSPQKTPQKISKPAHAAKPTTKKTLTVKSTPVQPLLRDLPREYPPPTVGHIFPRPWPLLDVSRVTAEPSPPSERPTPRHTVRPPTKKKAPVSPPPPPA